MQINQTHVGHGFPASLLEILIERLTTSVGPISKVDILDPDEHSNDRLEVLFRHGRKLVVKRGRYDWVGTRFDSSRMAGRRLLAGGDVIAPQHLDLPIVIDGHPLLAYWWIELPTLRELWDDGLREDQVPEVMRSWGTLIRKIHGVRIPGYGCLPDLEREPSDLEGFLQRDVVERLMPAVRWEWEEGTRAVERLAKLIPAVCARVEEQHGVLVHNDLHMANILCDTSGGEIRCVGILDLEACISGPPEADLASADVLQGPCFFHPIAEDCLRWIREGYGDDLDPFVTAWFRVYHLCNLGFYSGMIGYEEHAHTVAVAACAEARCLEVR